LALVQSSFYQLKDTISIFKKTNSMIGVVATLNIKEGMNAEFEAIASQLVEKSMPLKKVSSTTTFMRRMQRLMFFSSGTWIRLH